MNKPPAAPGACSRKYSMPYVFLFVSLAEAGHEGRRFVSEDEMRYVSYAEGPEIGDTQLPLFRDNLRHRGRQHTDAVPGDIGGAVPEVGQENAAHTHVAEKSYGFLRLPFDPIEKAVPPVAVGSQQVIEAAGDPFIVFFQMAANSFFGIRPGGII